MSGHDLIAWRARLGLSQAKAARSLGLARNTLRGYETGATIPRYVALACAALEAGLGEVAGDKSES